MIKWIIGKIDCLTGVHDWSPDDFNEIMEHMEVGDEATLRCARCRKQVVTIEKLQNGDLKWTPHVKEAIIYEVNPEFVKKHGQQYNLDRFQEDNK